MYQDKNLKLLYKWALFHIHENKTLYKSKVAQDLGMADSSFHNGEGVGYLLWGLAVPTRLTSFNIQFICYNQPLIYSIQSNIPAYIMIQVDIGGHPPFPTGSKHFSSNFGNLLFLAVFNF